MRGIHDSAHAQLQIRARGKRDTSVKKAKRWGSSVTRHPPEVPVLTSSAAEPVSEYTSRGRTWDFHPAGSGEGADFRVRFPILKTGVCALASISVRCVCVGVYLYLHPTCLYPQLPQNTCTKSGRLTMQAVETHLGSS